MSNGPPADPSAVRWDVTARTSVASDNGKRPTSGGRRPNMGRPADGAQVAQRAHWSPYRSEPRSGPERRLRWHGSWWSASSLTVRA